MRREQGWAGCAWLAGSQGQQGSRNKGHHTRHALPLPPLPPRLLSPTRMKARAPCALAVSVVARWPSLPISSSAAVTSLAAAPAIAPWSFTGILSWRVVGGGG